MNVIFILCDTLRRDHVSAYTGGRRLNQCWSAEAPPWSVLTPNIDRLAARGTRFTNCFNGSTPCMPARRDLYTGRYEFLERGWGPLEEDDLDLPRQVSGPPNQSVQKVTRDGYRVSSLVTDHFHLWEQGACNYHAGYTGFDFVRGCEADALFTDPTPFSCPEGERYSKTERHWRNVHHLRQKDGDYFCARVVEKACDWLDRNRAHHDFFLHLDIFDPHEPWDPPEDVLKQFDPAGYSRFPISTGGPYARWRQHLDPAQMQNLCARYAAKVVFLDRQLGRLFDTLDRLSLWEDTLVILTTDHGTYNGDHGRMGKLQTHNFDACSHIPFLIAHPGGGGETRAQLVQLVDVYPTVLEAIGRPLPQLPPDRPLHGVSLLPVLRNPLAQTRDYAVMGLFGQSVGITDGHWILHQSPRPENQPLYWYGYSWARFLPYDLGPYADGRRPVLKAFPWENTPTWLSDKDADPCELRNLADREPARLAALQQALRDTLAQLHAPAEQLERLGL